MASFTAEDIIDIVHGRLAMGMMPDEGGAICTDSRTIQPGDWYLALHGEKNLTGTVFFGDAFASGCNSGCIVEDRPALTQ